MRWQDINDLISEVFFFKKRSRSRTIWIRGGVLTTFMGLLFYLSLLTGVTIETSGDIYGCGINCNISVNITSTYYRIGIESFPIYFDKEIKYDVFVPTRGKGNWRPMVLGKDFIERKNKYNVLPNRFMVTINKKDWETIKYGVKMVGEHIDPYIFGDNIHLVDDKTVTEICEPRYKNWSEQVEIRKTCKGDYNDTNKTYNSDYPCDEVYTIEHINEQVGCVKLGKVNVSGVVISKHNEWCKLIGDEVCCLSNNDGGQYGAWWRTDKMVCEKVSSIE